MGRAIAPRPMEFQCQDNVRLFRTAGLYLDIPLGLSVEYYPGGDAMQDQIQKGAKRELPQSRPGRKVAEP